MKLEKKHLFTAIYSLSLVLMISQYLRNYDPSFRSYYLPFYDLQRKLFSRPFFLESGPLGTIKILLNCVIFVSFAKLLDNKFQFLQNSQSTLAQIMRKPFEVRTRVGTNQVPYYQVLGVISGLIIFTGLNTISDFIRFLDFGYWLLLGLSLVIPFFVIRGYQNQLASKNLEKVLDPLLLTSVVLARLSFLHYDTEFYIYLGSVIVAICTYSIALYKPELTEEDNKLYGNLAITRNALLELPIVSMCILVILQIFFLLVPYLELQDYREAPEIREFKFGWIMSYMIISFIVMATVATRSRNFPIDKLSQFFKYSTIVSIVLFLSIFMYDDIPYFVDDLLFMLPSSIGLVFLQLPVAISTGFEISLLRKRSELQAQLEPNVFFPTVQ